MKIEELLNAVDSGVVEEITISYCGGRIKIEPNNAPFELPNYPIAKIWQSENGRGLSVLLADNITKDERGAAEFDEKAYSDGYAQATADANAAAESVNAENAKKAAKMIIKYCARFRLCGKNCIFYREGSAGCALEFPYDYDIKEEKTDGGKHENNN